MWNVSNKAFWHTKKFMFVILVSSKHYIIFENCIILFYSLHKQTYMPKYFLKKTLDLCLLCPHAGATSVYRKLITNRDPLDKSNQLPRKIMSNKKIGHNSAIFLSRNKIHTSDLPQTGKINRVLWSEPFSLKSIFNSLSYSKNWIQEIERIMAYQFYNLHPSFPLFWIIYIWMTSFLFIQNMTSFLQNSTVLQIWISIDIICLGKAPILYNFKSIFFHATFSDLKDKKPFLVIFLDDI